MDQPNGSDRLATKLIRGFNKLTGLLNNRSGD
jgi:hypothetical protein